MKYIEAAKAIVSLSTKYSIYVNTDDFAVNYKGENIACVPTYQQYFVRVWIEKDFKNLPFSNKLYMILSELAMTPLDERKEEKKYLIHVFKGQNGYLNIVDGKFKITDRFKIEGIKTRFTDEEIKRLKQREDVPLDWKKVKLVPADED